MRTRKDYLKSHIRVHESGLISVREQIKWLRLAASIVNTMVTPQGRKIDKDRVLDQALRRKEEEAALRADLVKDLKNQLSEWESKNEGRNR